MNNLLCEKGDGIATITINRPQVHNALNTATLVELTTLIETLGQDDDVAVIILTGAGERAFVAGADISEMKDMTALEAKKFSLRGQKAFSLIENLDKPVIAAVNGFALGGGCELAMACDFRIASEKAKFGQPEVNLGVIAGFGGTQRLPRLVGKGMGKYLLMTGEMIDAKKALTIGLVNEVVAPEALLERCQKIAQTIATKSPVAIKLTKTAVNQGLELDLRGAEQLEAQMFGFCFATGDQKEGMSAFLEKRPAKFLGR